MNEIERRTEMVEKTYRGKERLEKWGRKEKHVSFKAFYFHSVILTFTVVDDF